MSKSEQKLAEEFEKFIEERKYLQNVSSRTIEWYRESFKWLNNPIPTKDDLKSLVVRMRTKGLKPTSCNNRIRAINAYLHWASGADENKKCGVGCTHLAVQRLKEEKRVLPTFSLDDVKKIIAWKPKAKLFCERRLYVLMLTLADTGCRIDELLSLKWTDVDFENLLITVNGKGAKQRVIPFSFELRKQLFKFKHEFKLVFPTRDGGKLGRRDVLRDVKRICRKLGVNPPERTLHSFRHTFAINYLRRGGSVFHLQKSLGHASLDQTREYANLLTDDLQAVHPKISLLAA